MPAAVPSTTDDLLDLIRKSGILSADSATATLAENDLPADPVHAANVLVRNGVLTQFQARMLLAGKVRGFRLGDYVIQDEVGKGGMGSVYLAEHQTLHRKAAVKVLAPGTAADKIALERFVREARTAAALDHPNVVKLYDIAKQGELRFLVMEYVEGKTLEQVLQTGGIAPNRAVGYIAQAAAGLQHAYEKGFIHRDIKPANLMLTTDGTVKILDMGLARSFEKNDGLTEAFDRGAVVGTADYVAPEQAMNQPDIDTRADIYSLGVTFYALVTGRPPFDGTTAAKLVQHQLKDAPSLTALDKTFPPKLAAVVTKMMAKNPDHRYQTPAEVILALEPWLTDSPGLVAAASRTGNGRTSTRQLRHHTKKLRAAKKTPGWVWAAVAAGALAVIGGGVAAAVLFLNDGKPTRNTGPRVPATQPDITPATDPTPATKQAGTPATGPKPAPVPEKVWTDGKVIYALDLSGQKPFAVETETGGAVKQSSGDGSFPDGWKALTWQPNERVKGFADAAKGTVAIGAQSVAGSGLLFSPEIAFKGKFVKVRFEYQSTATEQKCTVRFREMGEKNTVNTPLPPADTWTPFEKVYDVSAFKSAIRVEFHNSDKGTELRLRSFQLLETEERK